ncbi:MAG: hypothetical protein AB7K09_23315 [Planctomycetota bacterium]
MRTTLAAALADEKLALPGGYEKVMRDPGWLPALVRTISTLEATGLTSADLAKVKVEGGLSERARAIGQLMEMVEAARGREKIASRQDLAAAAREAIEKDRPVPLNSAQAAILLGDARGSRLTHETLRAWLEKRKVVRIDLPGVSALPPADHGLLAAAPPDTEVVAVQPPKPAPTVHFVRTPDPVRECTEAVREAQAAILAGTPIDRVAIVIPDPTESVALGEALERARIPATWQTGPPLLDTAAARFLLMLIDLELGENSVAHWYELLRQRSLRLVGQIGKEATQGRGSWRRILAQCGAYRGTGNILRALEATRDACVRDAFDDETRWLRRLNAIRHLIAAITAVRDDLAAIGDEPRPVGQWAREFSARLKRWWAPFPDQFALAGTLDEWGRSPAGPAITLSEMRATLAEGLRGIEYLRGSMNDPSIRVLSPMQVLGGSFDVVIATGLTQGHFPADPSEDPMLADTMVDALNAATGAGLFHSRDRVALERRRFASLQSGVARSLWLSVPRVEMLEGRELIPGSLVLALASEQKGERVGTQAFNSLCRNEGRRSRPWPDDPQRAIGSLEYRLARLHAQEDDTARRDSLIGTLAHPWSSRLVATLHARGRIDRGERHDDLRPFAGFVPANVFPCKGLDGEPLPTHVLAQLITEPEEFLLLRMLGAWRAPRLYETWYPRLDKYVRKSLLKQCREALQGPGNLVERLTTMFRTQLGDALARAGEGDERLKARVEELAERSIEELNRARPFTAPLPELTDAPLGEGPWHVCDANGRRNGLHVQWLDEYAAKNMTQKTPQACLGTKDGSRALAATIELAARADGTTEKMHWLALVKDSREADAAPMLDAMRTLVKTATTAANTGWYPASRPEAEDLAAWSGIGNGNGRNK